MVPNQRTTFYMLHSTLKRKMNPSSETSAPSLLIKEWSISYLEANYEWRFSLQATGTDFTYLINQCSRNKLYEVGMKISSSHLWGQDWTLMLWKLRLLYRVFIALCGLVWILHFFLLCLSEGLMWHAMFPWTRLSISGAHLLNSLGHFNKLPALYTEP